MRQRGRTKRVGRGIKALAAPAEPIAHIAPARFDVVVLVTSAGGLEALGTILRGLPDQLPAAVIIAQHLGGQASGLVNILGRRTAMPVAWASTGDRLTPGQVLVAPRRQLEILPDGTCALGAESTARDHPLDALLESIADSCGPRALAVVLTGMGKDGSLGAAALKRAGGVVLVQSEETAEQPSMPRAAIASGASDLVLPLHEIAAVIADVVTGGELPRPRKEVEAAEALFGGPGQVRQLLRDLDWTRTALGPVAGWPTSLRTTLRLVLDSPLAMAILWGRDLTQLYNDSYRIVMGGKHPAGLGQPTQVCWPEVWHLNEPIYSRVLSGESVALADARYPITRRGTLEDAWFDLSFTPVRGENGKVAGVLATMFETTDRVLSQRRLRTLQALTAVTTGGTSVHAAMDRALASLAGGGSGRNVAREDRDVPFALAYLQDASTGLAELVASMGVDAGGPMAPHAVDTRSGHQVWPLGSLLNAEPDRRPLLLLDDLAERFYGALAGPGEEAPSAAILLPLRPVADEAPVGVVVLGINPRLVLDDTYRAFLELVAARVSANLAEALIRQKERERLDRLAELDRSKTEFFSNISHEFRTPLTLMLGPLEEISRRGTQLPESMREDIHLAARNARRLLNQVNTLLDFSQVEARRLHPRFEPTDLASLTRDIASVFRSATERAGLRLTVECPPLDEPVWVDPQMWEKIVSNLLSNALKFTFAGEITVELSARARHVELTVRDTGMGIPEHEQQHLFKRFHRVRGQQGRTSEGSGIGLALVYELTRLHQGRVRVYSTEGEGSTFTVWVPMGRRARISPSPPATPADAPSRPEVAAALAEIAAGWVAKGAAAEGAAAEGAAAEGAAAEGAAPSEVEEDLLGPPTKMDPGEGSSTTSTRARVLVVDDNPDMRDYLRRLLSAQWDVVLAGDGPAALAAIADAPPDAILADVMMPGFDGFELLRRIRTDPALGVIPIVLVTARTGEQEAIEGLRAGADDYIAKPFSPRELVARVQAVLERSRVEAALREREEALHATTAQQRRMTELLGIGILTFEPGSGTLLDANDAFLAMSGYTREQIERGELTWRTMTPPEYVETTERQMRRLAETGQLGPYTKEYLGADGSRSRMIFTGARLADGRVVEYCIRTPAPAESGIPRSK